jgi:rod shape-determining protein MreC
MESFFSRYKNALVLIVVLVAQLLALAIQVKRPAPGTPDQESVSLIRYVVVSVVTPPERWLHNIGRGIRGLWSGYVNLIHVRQEDAGLKAQIEQLRLEQASIAEDAKQGQRLQRLLDFKQHYIYKTLPAQVIGVSGTDQSRTLYIDKGTKEGLAPDMPVVTADGIVGKLKDVFDHKSLVVLISDPTSGVGVILETTRTRGILKGAALGEMQVINVSPDDRIKPGERIVTSGGDQIFPRGMPVGTVERVTPDPDRDPLVDVAVRPAANLSRLEEVLVITDTGETPSQQAARDLVESEAEGVAAQRRASDVLSERLPARLDTKAPADTNPDPNAGANGSGVAGEDVRLLTPPRPLRPDQYSPDATPPSAEMAPGQRRAPVLQGTEDVVTSAPQKKPAAVAASTPAALTPNGGGASGSVKKATSATTGPATTTGAAATTAATTTATRTGPLPSAMKTPTGNTVANGETASPGVSTVKPVRPANNGTLQSGKVIGSGAAGSSRPLSSAAAGNGAGNPLKTRIIIDGPMNNAGTNARVSGDQAGNGAASAPAKKKGPEIVPDDGSRPPGSERTGTAKPAVQKPKPAVQSSQPAAPPNGGR